MIKDNSRIKLVKIYNKSVLLDQFIAFLLMIMVSTLLILTTDILETQTNFYLSVSLTAVICLHLFSDILFGGRSLGKRIFKISIGTVNSKIENGRLTLKQCTYRRLLEIVYNPYHSRDILEAFAKIEKKTGTTISLNNKRGERNDKHSKDR